jgi:hypothetical protein
MKTRVHIAIVVSVAIASLATGVALASGRYVLRHPRSEHCRRNYVRVAKTVRIKGRRVTQVWCVRRAPKPAAPKQAPAGSLEWLLAHTSVVQAREVLAREAAPTFAGWRSKGAGENPGEQRQWLEPAPECTTGVTGGAGYISCEKKAELHFTWVRATSRAVPCSQAILEVNPWATECSEPYNELVTAQPQKYRAILEVSANDGSALCGDLTFQYFLGSQWEYAEASRPTCNVNI